MTQVLSIYVAIVKYYLWRYARYHQALGLCPPDLHEIGGWAL